MDLDFENIFIIVIKHGMAKKSSQASGFSRLATRSAAKLRLFACNSCRSPSTVFSSKREMDKHEKLFHPRIFAVKRMHEERKIKTEAARKKMAECRKRGRKTDNLTKGRLEKKVETRIGSN